MGSDNVDGSLVAILAQAWHSDPLSFPTRPLPFAFNLSDDWRGSDANSLRGPDVPIRLTRADWPFDGGERGKGCPRFSW